MIKGHDNHKKPADESEPAPDDQVAELRPVDYIRTMNFHLMKGNQRDAYAVLKPAVVLYPDDPYILSYYGSFQAVLDKKYKSGIENCRKAIVLLMKKLSGSGEMKRFAVFYLNFGRAYLAGGKKKDAIAAFKKGLQYDTKNAVLLKEMQALGTRKNPSVAFLDRANPINKYLGMIRHQEKKPSAGGVTKGKAQK
jgi:tetratricopeptide (TPR) repeat protein